MDVLDDVLSALRLSGGVILEGHARGDWCVLSQFRSEDVAHLFPGGGPIIAYHYIQSGTAFAAVDGHPPIEAPAGSILMFPRNDRHRLYTAPAEQPVDSHELVMASGETGYGRLEIEGEGEEVEFFCGFLGVAQDDNPLLDCLPPILIVEDVERAQEQWLEGNFKFLTASRRTPETVARIAELLFAHAVRAYAAALEPGEGGWLAALKDPAVARALRIIHSRYAEDLQVDDIAREAGVSRSVLGERFVELLGEPPMRYCAKWRMRAAAEMLRDGKEHSANIGYSVGFNSEAAFNRAFKRFYGEPPATWKRHLAERSAGAPSSEPEAMLAQARKAERTGTCLSADGTPIGWSDMGEGFPLLQPAIWFHQVAQDCTSPVWRHWLGETVARRRLIRTDFRGTGASGRDPPRWTFDALLDDFTAVADAVGEERFDLIGYSHASLVAIAYAARYPHRVRKLILVGGYAQGFEVRADPEEIARRESLLALGRNFQGGDGETFARMLGSLYWPGARDETLDWFAERLGTVLELDESLQTVFRTIDLAADLQRIQADTLIMHSQGDRIIGCRCSEDLVEGIPNARFVPLESDNHIPIGAEPAWQAARAALIAHLEKEEAHLAMSTPMSAPMRS